MSGEVDPVILFLGFGPLSADQIALPDAARAIRMVSLPAQALSGTVIHDLNPAEVVTPLVGAGCDAGSVAQTLESVGYRGILRVVCPALPDSAMVRRELDQMAPGLRIELILPT